MDPLGGLAALASALRRGSLSVEECLARLRERAAEWEPRVQSLLPEQDRFARLERQARELAARWPDPGSRPALYGVPVAVKDIFHVDGYVTRAGSDVAPSLFAGPQAASVTRLQEAGALVLGKAVTTEFAYYSPGPTRNPHDPGRTPGGSSSGSAAAVAARVCPLALGTQTGGSMMRPASYCGVVGFKPSRGRVPTQGVVPVSESADTVGWFTRDVDGAALAASVLADGWRGEVTAPPLVLALPLGPFLDQAEPAALTALDRAAETLSRNGFHVLRLPAVQDYAALRRRHEDLIAAEMYRAHAPWFERCRHQYQPKTLAQLERGRAVPDADLPGLRASCLELRQRMGEAMDREGVAAWITPSSVGPALVGLGSTGEHTMNLVWSHAGMPTVSLPVLAVDGLPVGLQMAAPFGRDEELLALSRAVARVLPFTPLP